MAELKPIIFDSSNKDIYFEIKEIIDKNNPPTGRAGNKIVFYPDFRISKSYLMQKFLSNELNGNIHGYKMIVNIQNQYWVMLSRLVMEKISLGFPLIVKRVYNGGKLDLFFECFEPKVFIKHGFEYMNIYSKPPEIRPIIFQKLFILYELWYNGLWSENFLFNYIAVSETPIIFKIKDLRFKFNIPTLVTLRQDTCFQERHNIPQNDYIASLNSTLRTKLENCSNFISAFLFNYFDYIFLEHLPILVPYSPKNTTEYENVGLHYGNGKIVLYCRDNKFENFGITYCTNNDGTFYSVVIFNPTLTKKIILHTQVIDYNNLFKNHNYLVDNLIVIGRQN